MESDLRESVNRRLLVAKSLFEQAEVAASATDAISKMIAMQLLQSAVETTLRNIYLAHEVPLGKGHRVTFEQLISGIAQHRGFLDSGLELPSRQQIRELNAERVDAHHFAQEPAESTVAYLVATTKRFLKVVFVDFFDESFDSISRLALIKDERVVDAMSMAEEQLLIGNWHLAFGVGSSVALECSQLLIRDVFPTRQSFSQPPAGQSIFGVHAGGLEQLDQVFGYLSGGLDAVENLLLLQSSGVDLVRWSRLSSISQGPPRYLGGEFVRRVPIGGVREEDARWAIQFIVDTLIKWQAAGLSPRLKEGSVDQLRRYVERGSETEGGQGPQ